MGDVAYGASDLNPPDQVQAASIEDVDAAIFEALKTIPGIAKCERFATTRNTMTDVEILAMAGGKSPALFLCQGPGSVTTTVETLALGSAEEVDRIEWRVLLVVIDTKQPKDALTGKAPGLRGLYPLLTLTLNAINGLFIPGLWNDSQLESRGHEWGLVEPGKLYVNVLRFVSAHVLGAAPRIDLSRPLEEIRVNVQLADTLDPPHVATIDQVEIDDLDT